MGEVLPQSMKLMALAAQDAGISVSGSVAEMLKLQQTGSLISEKVLPHFGRRMREAAKANGGLDAALNSNRVAMNRMMFSISEAADLVFKSGFATGLTELFNTSAESIVGLKELWQSLGAIIGSIFKVMAAGVRAITPTLKAIGSILKGLTDTLGENYSWILATTGAVGILFKLMKHGGWKKLPIVGQFLAILQLIKEAAFWGEELMNIFTQDKIGILYDPRKDKNGIGSGIEGTGFMPDLKNILGAANSSVLSDLSLNNQLMKLLTPAIASMMNITVELNVDGEALGNSMANTNSINNMVDKKVSQVQQ